MGTEKMCKKKDAIVGCLTGTAACSSMVKDIGGPKAADLECMILDMKCNEKGEKLMECVGDDMAKWSPCDEAASKGDTMDAECCPILKSIVGCYTQGCIDALLARNQLMADSGDE